MSSSIMAYKTHISRLETAQVAFNRSLSSVVVPVRDWDLVSSQSHWHYIGWYVVLMVAQYLNSLPHMSHLYGLVCPTSDNCERLACNDHRYIYIHVWLLFFFFFFFFFFLYIPSIRRLGACGLSSNAISIEYRTVSVGGGA